MRSIEVEIFSSKWEKYFSFLPTYSRIQHFSHPAVDVKYFSRNEFSFDVETNASGWCFSALIVIPKEQYESWIQITVPKACKTSVNEEKKDLL